MAKKSRTPAPPRTVQAPQRRSDPKRPRVGGGRNLPLWIGIAAVVIVAVVLAVVFVGRGGSNNSAGVQTTDQSQLAGLQIGPAPWNPGLDTLPDRLAPLGVHDLTSEGQVVHIHQHLDVFVNGKREPVPQGIGIYDGQFLTELHTHDSSGIMHVESPTATNYSLGQFFGVWGVRLTTGCIGGYCHGVTPWTVYVNGQAY
ncbi:MAG TPA: hypothetical protein VE757_01200, partial [Gaiellaceae bacterium]|nr:hypothetical protein [Gaiellaceae bacterium]